MAETEAKKDNAFVNWITSGASGNKRYVEQIGELEENIADASAGILSDSGAMTEEESAAWRATQQAGIDEKIAENLKKVTADCTVNAVVNAAGLALSGIGIGDELVGVASKGAVKLGLTKNLASASLKSSGSAVGKVVGSVVSVGEKAATGVWHGIKGLAKGKVLSGIVKTAAGVAVPVAPFVAARMYTESRTSATAESFEDAADACKDRYAYLLEQGGNLTEDQRKAYGEWSGEYESEMAELAEKKDSMTDAEYAEAYGQLAEKYNAKREELDGEFAEKGLYITDDGAAANLEAHLEEELSKDPDYDWEEAAGGSYFNEKSLEEHPERAKQVACVEQTVAKTAEEGSFVRFLKDLNATMLHYVPGLSYVEAAVVKGADSLMAFIANDAPLISGVIPDYEEKHDGETITEIAQGMVEDASERYAAKDEVAEAVSAAETDSEYEPV